MAVLVCVAGMTPALAHARPTSASKKAEAAAVKKQVDALDEKLDVANENYNEANIAYNEAIAKRKKADKKLKKTEARLNTVQDHLNTRANDMYREGPGAFLEVLLGAQSFDDFAALWDTLNNMNRTDAASTVELKTLRAETKALRAELKDAEAAAKKQNDKKKKLKEEAAAALAERKAKLRGLEAEVAALQRAEAAAAEAEARRRSASSSYLGGGKKFPAPTRAARSEVVNIAKKYLGAPYRWGAAGPNSFDCSGFTMFVFKQVGVSLPHSSRAQINSGQRVSRSDLQPGDLVFFGSPIHHVGLYVGGGQMIHAPHSGDVVRYAPAFRSDFVGACRP
ncbi:MAG: C40 family peptidase [Actinomycetes bacterium]|jgi:cell wall-associated NlpC family hydrolase|nr:C40 family peptidase [Actinomycetes bacterium]